MNAHSDTKPEPELTIGQLATAVGINVESVRYYQRIGLIIEPRKPEHGFRKYTKQTVERIMFIKRAQKLGFNLKEIADLLALGDGNCRDVRISAEKKREKIQKQIHDLQALQDTLTQLINTCHSGKENQKCPIVETLLATNRVITE